jgi:tRNA (adenine57-N1/adenine58-N1)-methyltransferase
MQPISSLSPKYGDLVQVVSPTNKMYFFHLSPGGQFQTHRGIVRHDNLINTQYGSQFHSHNGSVFYLLQPTLGDLLLQTPRNTQIMYPKDIGYTIIKMGIGSGYKIIEAGTGSGALTIALAWSVNPGGMVYSYDTRVQMQQLAYKNLKRLSLEKNVLLKTKDIGEGFDEISVDALFLDLPNPYDYLENVRDSLKPGGSFGCILPTINQVSRLLLVLHQNNFAFVEVCEILLQTQLRKVATN